MRKTVRPCCLERTEGKGIETYSCRIKTRFFFAGITLVFGSAFLFFFLTPLNVAGGFPTTAQHVAAMLPLGLLFGGVAGAGVVGLLLTLTVYRLDERGITKRWWNGSTQRLLWIDLMNAEPMQDGSGALTDLHGGQLSLPSAEFGYRDRQGRTLQNALGEYLTRLPQETKRRLEMPREFRMRQKAVELATGFMTLLLIACAVSEPLLPFSGPPPPLAAKIAIPGFFLLGALFIAYLGLRLATGGILLTDHSLIDRSLFGRREIPFAQIVSITAKEVPTKTSTIEVTTIKSATTTIRLTSQLPNYDKLTAFLQAKAGARVTVNAPQVVVSEARQSLLVSVIGLFIIGCLFGLALGGFAMTLMHDGQAALQRQAELDIHGRRTTGEAIGVEVSGSKSRSYSLEPFSKVGCRRGWFVRQECHRAG